MNDADSFLLIISGISIIGGVIFGLYYTRIFSFIFDLNKNKNQQNFSATKKEEEEEKIKEQEDVLKTKPDLIKKKSKIMEDELKIYQFEKDLASHAIENILIASKNNEIDSYEKDRLLLKYKDQLKKLNEKLEKIHSEIDVTELIILRNDLAFLLNNKISDIDQKISEINFKIGTNYKVKEIVNQNRKNTSHENNTKNINNHFVDNIEETVDSNLNTRELTSYKNNPTQKRKDASIETERKKIDELKDQVLVALNRLDKTENIKIDLDDDYNHNNPKKVTEDKTITLADKDLAIPYNFQEELEINKQENSSIQNNKESVSNLIENNLNIPKIFSHTDIIVKDEVMTTKVAFEPQRNMAGERLKNYKVDVNQNRTNESKSLAELDMEKRYLDIERKYHDVNKKMPLSNLLSRNNLNFDHSLESKYKESNISNDQINKSKQSLNNNSNNKDKKNVFKFPFVFIFSKINKKVKNKRTKERANKKNVERKDSLSNIANKKDKRIN
jgi:hypothetical protein